MANELKYLKEYLSTFTGTEGTLLVPRKIYERLIEEADKNLIPRSEAAMYFGPGDIPGSSLDLNLVTPDSMDVRIVGEGAEVVMDNAEYTNLNLKPVKYGVAIRITKEMLEDGQHNLLQHNIGLAGKRFAENENSLIVTALDAAANTVTGGAAITIANIARAMQFLEDSDYAPTSFAVGMEVLNDLRNIDTFVEADKVGNREAFEKGFLGTIYGMSVIKVSTNAGMTTTSSYVYDKSHGFVIAEKRPITVEGVQLPHFDMEGAVITQRITAVNLRSSAVAKITTT